ncbi:MAG: SpoVR family protein [Planctomycetota bacterium]|nr:MAG: SpoVR family protein [Planctomycetota bacterium]
MRGGLTPELAEWAERIEAWAREYGLDFWSICFELLDYDQINEVAAYGGFPTRYPHWKWGMDFEQLNKGYVYGLQKIYELVINNDPCYAYLMKSNSIMDQKLVMAHVCGHADFFKNNLWFSKTNRKMMDQMANHGTRIRRYAERIGHEEVESFIDCCLSIDNLIDIHSPFVRRRRVPDEDEDDLPKRPVPKKLRSKDYMDRFVNPPEFLEEQTRRLQEAIEKRKNFPEHPERDVMLFLLEHAPLDRWQRDILGMIREEAYYFAPQAQTKIMNEGWASYWHSKLMTEKILTDAEVIDYADHHAGTMGTRPGVLNPYKIGIELFRDIEERWDKGKFGKEWEECDDAEARRAWDKKLGLGREKIFEVRRIYNDVMFIDEFLTEDFAREQKMFTFEYSKQSDEYVIASREFREIKSKLLDQLTNWGNPFIAVQNGNHENRGELYLVHEHMGTDLDLDHARDVLKNLQRIWSRPVHLETVVEKRRKLLSYNGRKHGEKNL